MVEIKISDDEKSYLKSLKTVDEYSEKRELAKEILKGIAMGGVIATVFVLPGMAVGFNMFFKTDYKYERKKRRIINKLLRDDFIKKTKENKYFITAKGQIKINKYEIDDIQINIEKKWDGYFRIITFDISNSYARSFLTHKLKKFGFRLLQDSMYVFPFDFEDEFKKIGKYFGVSKDILYIKTKEVSNYKKLTKAFKKDKIIHN